MCSCTENTSSIGELLERYKPYAKDSLIPVLQEVQQVYGFLSYENLVAVSKAFGLSLAKVYGVASFYNQFKFNTPGRYNIQVCRGTACHVKGSAKILEKIKRVLNINEGETTKDGLFSIEVVACVGACSLAPVLCINGEYYSRVTPDQVEGIINNLRDVKHEKDL
ncbi:MAG: NAD(P)H-dependent oxidoreductase subunit E [Oligoflexia bacterium]|nr:NAD(P)H-dependent oxidoreductase subunit E [Oligoflexia bacterium]